MYDISLSVVIIAYNESACLEIFTKQTIAVLEENFSQYELIIVNDGSSDNTGEIADNLSGQNDKITVVHHHHNRGIDNAVKTGFSNVKYDYVTWLPADGQIEAKELLKFMPVIKDYDMVLSVYSHRPVSDARLFISKYMRRMIKLAIGFDRRNEGVYIIKRDVLKSIPLDSESVLVHFELPMKVAKTGGTLGEVIIDCKPRIAGKSKAGNIRTILLTFWDLLKLRFLSKI